MKKQFIYGKTVLDNLEKTTLLYPDKTAIRDTEGSMTYEELQKTSEMIGVSLYQRTAGRGSIPIVIFMEKGCSCFSAMLGALYSGKPYVPMDIKTPAERLEQILKMLDGFIMVADEKGSKNLARAGYKGDYILYDDLINSTPDSEMQEILDHVYNKVLDTDIMYILFTSGSTGVPKGVAVTHRSVLDYIRAFIAETPITGSDILGNQTPFYVDMSLKDLYMGISVGATICVIPQRFFMTPKKLLQYLDDCDVTMLMWVPTAYSIVSRFDALSQQRPSKIRKLLFSGESMPIPVFRYWREHYPEAVFIQQYGPTEITGACTNFIVDRDYDESETIPIGKPFDNTGLILLDDEDRLIPSDHADVIGEICVYGSCLAAGYYNDPEKTRQAFVLNPLIKTHPVTMYRTGDLARYDHEGNIVFVSRKDYQIKHGGRRIELGEIEAGIYEVAGIDMCCCVHNAEKDEIAVFYVGDIQAKELRLALRDRLPQYMLPTAYHKLEELPRLNNGKLNRKLMTEWAHQEDEKE